ncbi:polyprenol reductase [Phymastichus coffea]|uniref:polyprenol reductase n=1 Tax=Phymastichus coffea TaxID=108790 RepID=UPI00273C191D|nr:polyprenol reductase [Phymastichus coffea]XP_058789004.1 polyprenol reductase [Phymastichus coffea]XP_058789005.1 polyprenol reductase [Phymastichus coffea]XP_058789006.1 polyprenol reductase [Phymastichus coffea]XP_058789007.1 polyprenol reductase [Phymastichus coffea]
MLNLLKVAFLFKFVSTVFGGFLINFFGQFLPDSFKRIYLPGRFNECAKSKSIEKFEVPKRWFRHFYLFAAPYSTFYLLLLCYRYLLNGRTPNFVNWQISIFFDSSRETPISAERVLLGMLIFTAHCWKRYYESHYISVFSDSTINLSVYIIGFTHYFGGILSIVGESQSIDKDSTIHLNWSNLTWLEYTCASIFILSTYLQLRTNIILSNLRKNEKGVVITKQHKIPRGELFEYITAPLQFTEIILYLCMSIILREGSTFHYVTLWTVANQVECSYLAHTWFLNKFKDYPKSRKMIVPYIF